MTEAQARARTRRATKARAREHAAPRPIIFSDFSHLEDIGDRLTCCISALQLIADAAMASPDSSEIGEAVQSGVDTLRQQTQDLAAIFKHLYGVTRQGGPLS
jgi:hypothetical protein